MVGQKPRVPGGSLNRKDIPLGLFSSTSVALAQELEFLMKVPCGLPSERPLCLLSPSCPGFLHLFFFKIYLCVCATCAGAHREQTKAPDSMQKEL